MAARLITIAQPPAKPWRNRAAIMTSTLGVSVYRMDATVINRIAAISGRRRPFW